MFLVFGLGGVGLDVNVEKVLPKVGYYIFKGLRSWRMKPSLEKTFSVLCTSWLLVTIFLLDGVGLLARAFVNVE